MRRSRERLTTPPRWPVGASWARLLAILLPLVVAGCGSGPTQQVPEVLRIFPHDPDAYTQGLVIHEGRFYESTGRYGASTLREVDLESGQVLRSVELSETYFGEGLERVGNRLLQLTWREGVAFLYDIDSFEVVDRFEYDGEGWGLCHDGESYFMTTGGSFLHRRDTGTFELLESLQITQDGRALLQVNELACVGQEIYGNVYQTDRIVRIDKRTGTVVGVIDASNLVPPGGRPAVADAVLNGIAHDPERGTFYLTGKLWSAVFEVRFVPK